MRIFQLFAYCTLATSAANAASVPEVNALVDLLDTHTSNAPRAELLAPENRLEKRKGGGGKGGGGGGGSSGGGKSGGGGGGGGGSSGRTGTGSNVGGATRSGSGPSRSFGGGGYYGGGAATPYKSGSKTPRGLIAGAVLLPVAVLAIMPGLWLYGAYPYNLHPYSFRNQTRNATNVARQAVQNVTNGVNQTLPVTCLCQDYAVCGCDDNDNPQYIADLVGNGSYAALNKTLVTVSEVNGTTTLVINGTLPNGTTAPGGTDDSGAAGLTVSKYTGYLAMVMIVVSIVTTL